MRLTSLLIMITACSTAPKPIPGTDHVSTPIRTCRATLPVIDADPTIRSYAYNASAYWYDELSEPHEKSVPLIVSLSTDVETAHYRGIPCRYGVILVHPRIMSWPPDAIETVLRHEMGHALGLPDHDDPVPGMDPHVMVPHVDRSAALREVDPVDLRTMFAVDPQ